MKFSIAYYVGTNLGGHNFDESVCSGWLDSEGTIPNCKIHDAETMIPLRRCLETLKDHSDNLKWSVSPYTHWIHAVKVEPCSSEGEEGLMETTFSLCLSFVTRSSAKRLAKIIGVKYEE